SYNYGSNPPTFRADAGMLILLGILISAIIYIAGMAASGASPGWMRLRFCPQCGRQIPFDAALCPYCGNRFP
ncbi:MAG TPA: zinc ribbon domain-containing protein, partial [Thermoplasmata archaeon]|nr:zinc ribbon domain-containing protein [Thermoplasmata archaeon]